MKNLTYLLLVVAISVQVGCNGKQKTNSDKTIVGIWQKANDTSIAIEFTHDFEYYFRFEGKRIKYKEPTSKDLKVIKEFNDSVTKDKNLKICDSKVEKYSYDSLSKGNNLKISTSSNKLILLGRLTFIDQNRIKISLGDHDSIVSTAEYYKVQE